MIQGFFNNISGGAGQATVENVLNSILNQSGLAADLAHLASYLKARETFITGHKAAFAPSLANLDPQTYSLGFLYIL